MNSATKSGIASLYPSPAQNCKDKTAFSFSTEVTQASLYLVISIYYSSLVTYRFMGFFFPKEDY